MISMPWTRPVGNGSSPSKSGTFVTCSKIYSHGALRDRIAASVGEAMATLLRRACWARPILSAQHPSARPAPPGPITEAVRITLPAALALGAGGRRHGA